MPLRALWNEPRPAGALQRVWRDWALLVAVVVAATIEGLVRNDLSWRWLQVAVTVGLAPTLLWRRRWPLAMIVLGIGGCTIAVIATGGALAMNTLAYMLILPYALFRWGSGREAILGAGMGAVAVLVPSMVGDRRLSDVVGGLVVVGATMALGTSVRYRATARHREVEQIRLRERESLARDLHDTVAHHVSAIAVRAQAGLAVSGQDATAAVDSLRVVEAEASRALAEMRTMVRVLREGQTAQLAPTPELANLAELAHGPAVPVEIQVNGEPSAVSTPVGNAVYRLAQESVTNALRHARNLTRVRVQVDITPSAVRLEVRDDADPPSDARGAGFGLAGMAERVAMLGGTFHAGPGAEHGWIVTAELPQ